MWLEAWAGQGAITSALCGAAAQTSSECLQVSSVCPILRGDDDDFIISRSWQDKYVFSSHGGDVRFVMKRSVYGVHKQS